MSEHSAPGWSGPLPDPAVAGTGPTSWGPTAHDYGSPADGISSWSAAVAPRAVPAIIAEGPQSRPGWLTRGRCGNPDDA